MRVSYQLQMEDATMNETKKTVGSHPLEDIFGTKLVMATGEKVEMSDVF